MANDIVWETAPEVKQSSGITWETAPNSDITWETEPVAPKGPMHNWGTTDARDAGKVNPGMSAPERKGSIGERIGISMQNAMGANKYISRDTGQTQALQAKRLRDSFARNPHLETPERKAKAENLQKDAEFRLAKYLILRESLNADMQEYNPSFGENLAGSLVPSMLDELNLVPIGKGARVATTALKGAGGGLVLGIVSAWEQGQHDKAVGLIKKDPDLAQLLEAGMDTAMIVSAISTAFHIRGNYYAGLYDKKPKTDASVIAEKLKPVLQDVDTSGLKTPQYMSKPKREAAQSVVEATGEPAHSQMDYRINEKEYNKPYWVDPELQKSIEQANNVVDDAATMQGMKDVNAEQIKSPYMSNAEVKTAQGFADAKDAPAAWEMDFKTEEPKLGGKETGSISTERAGGPEYFTDLPIKGGYSNIEERRQKDIVTNAKLANELHQVKTLPEAITTVRKYLKDPDQLAVSEVLQKFASKDTGFQALNPEDVASYGKDSAVHALNDTPTEPGALGLHMTTEQGAQNVAVRGINYFLDLKKRDGLNPETVLHETAHSITDKAFFVASHPELAAQPKYANHVRYSADMNDLRLALMKEMSPEDVAHFAAAFENAAEFNAYGWTSPNFREFLSKVELKNYGKSAWERFKDIVKQFFGQDINTVNALKAVDGFMDRLDYIQHAEKADVGKAVQRLNAADAVSTMRDKPQTAEELKTKVPIEDVPDLTPFTGKNLLTSNQVKNTVKHPWVDFVWEKMNTIKRQEEVKQASRRELYDATLKGTDEKTKVKLYQTLVKINTEPYEVRAQVEAGGMPAIIEYFKSKGLNDAEANKLATMSAILRDVEGSDIASASLFDRGWQHQPLYAPLSHAGRFRVIANDAEGNVVMARGFDKASDAALFYTELKSAGLPDGVTLENVQRSEINSLKAGLAELMLDSALPDYLKKQVQTVEQRMEVARRRFEMERRKDAVHGFVGEDLGDPNTGFGKRQQKALIDAFEARIDASFDFGVKARIAKEILEPLLADPAVQALRPELYNYLNQLVMREMGFPIAKTKAFDAKLQAAADTFFGKPMNKLNNILRGNEPNDVSMLGPRAVENLVQGWTWFTSLAKLGWNINTWAANSTAIPLVSLEGWRVAHKEGVSPWYAVLAANDSRQFALGLSQSKDARVFMEQAKREGMVDALISDTYTLDPDARRGLPDKIANAPRDTLEYATNFNTIHYFYHFYKRAFPEMDVTSEAFKTKVYEAARSWTGDYSPQATPLALSQLGTAGRAMGNFSKWRFNQLGRLVDDVSTLKDNPGSVHAWGALTALLTTQVLMGGAYGLMGVADYEALRRFGQWTGMWEWRPFSLYYEDMNKYLDGKIPEWVRRGAITAASDKAAQELFNEKTGPDVSGSLRFSSFLEPPTVAFKYFTDVLGGIDWVAKRALMEAGIGKGVTHQSSKEAIDALPTSLKSVVNDWFKTVKIDPNTGEKTYITQQKKLDKGNFEQNEFQRRLDMIGLKTTAENNYNDKVFGAEWTKKYTAKQITERLSAAINWVYEPAGSNPFNKAGVNDPKPDVVKKNLQEVYKLGGITSLREFEKQLMEKPLDRATTYDQRLVGDILRQQDAVRKSRMLETLQKFIAEKESRNTSSNR